MSRKPAKSFPESFFESDLKPLLVVVLVPLVIYLQTLWYGFTPMDEHWLILNNEPFLKEPGNIWRTFLKPTCEVYYRPLMMSSFIVDYKISHLQPFSYHLTNIILHLGNVIFLYKLLKQYPIQRNVSFILVLLFSIHPAILSNVAWVPGRNDTILSLFFIASLYFQNLFLRSEKVSWLSLWMLAFLGGLLTKESAVFFPVIYIANAYIAGKIKANSFKINVPLLLITVIWFLVRKAIVPEMQQQGVGFWEHTINFFKVMLVYIGKSLLPIQQSVFPTISNASIIPGLVTLVIIIAVFLFGRINNKPLTVFGLLIFVGVLIVPVWFMSFSVTREQYENRIYIPMIGMILFVSQIKMPDVRSLRIAMWVSFGALYLGLTFIRMDDYKDEYSFLQKAMKENPDNYFFHQKMADQLMAKNDLLGAIREYDEAIRIQPSRTLFYNNRAVIYTRLGRHREALRDCDSAVVRSNYDPVMCLNRAIVLSDLGDDDAAVAELKRLKQCCQGSVSRQAEDIIVSRWKMNGFKKIEELLKQEPDNAFLYANRAILNYELGRKYEALADKQKALTLDPNNEQIKKSLAHISP